MHRPKRGIMLAILLFSAATSFTAEKPLRAYNTLMISRFTVGPQVAKAQFPAGYEDVLQKTLLARLLSERVFSNVIDASDNRFAGIYGTEQQPLIAEGKIVDFSRGNRAARVGIGYGAGAAKIAVVLTFRDPATGREVLRLEQTGRYIGFGDLTGGSADKARAESARKVIDGLIKKIKAAR